jgi:hypothetical protein
MDMASMSGRMVLQGGQLTIDGWQLTIVDAAFGRASFLDREAL